MSNMKFDGRIRVSSSEFSHFGIDFSGGFGNYSPGSALQLNLINCFKSNYCNYSNTFSNLSVMLSDLVWEENVVRLDVQVNNTERVDILETCNTLITPPQTSLVLTFNDLLHEDLDLLLRQLVVGGGHPLEQVPACQVDQDQSRRESLPSTEEEGRKDVWAQLTEMIAGGYEAQIHLLISNYC